MEKTERKKILRLLVQILLPIACAAWVAFIFSNSLRTGEQSTEQSSTVVEVVQKVVQVFAPNSSIATATGPAYDKLHAVVRTLAHFAEFAVLGALLCWCYFAYTKKWSFVWLPLLGLLFVPAVDELLQKWTDARAAQWSDYVVDVGGCLTGFVFAWFTLLFVTWLCGKIKNRKENEAPMSENNNV